MQEKNVEIFRPQPPQRLLAGADRPLIRGILRQDLAHDEEPLTIEAPDRLTDDLFGAAVAVHLGGIDVGHSELDAAPQGPLRLVDASPTGREFPRPLPDASDLAPCRSERAILHSSPSQKKSKSWLWAASLSKPPSRSRSTAHRERAPTRQATT